MDQMVGDLNTALLVNMLFVSVIKSIGDPPVLSNVALYPKQERILGVTHRSFKGNIPQLSSLNEILTNTKSNK